MKLKFLIISFLCSALFFSCEKNIELTDAEIASALKEALTVGIGKGVDKAEVTDGYFGDTRLKIPFPADASVIETTLRTAGFSVIVDELILKLNRSAENAANKAEPIFVDAITNMTISDAVNILHGADNAATEFLEAQTRSALYTAFKPDIEASLNSVGATSTWTTVVTTYNTIPFVPSANADLPDYTTNKALDGLFVLLADEELKIRKDPVARITDLLRKVFGELD